MASEIKVDTISEKTSANGVTIDSLSIKDGGLIAEGNIDVNGNNLVLDANANTYLDAGTDDTIKFYVSGAHDLTISANAINVLSGTTLTIDSGATIANSGTATGFSSADPASADGDTLGTASLEWSDLYLADSSVIYFGADQDITLTHVPDTGLILGGTTPTLTIGDAGAEDTKIVFDGNAQDFHIGLDDTADSLVIGLGSALGTTSHIVIDATGAVTKPLQPAFFANKTDSGQTPSANTATTVTFNNEIFDQNGDFASSIFTAPVAGRYYFKAAIRTDNITGGTGIYSIRLVCSNRTIKNEQVDLSDYLDGTMNQMVFPISGLMDMDASDTAKIQVYEDSGFEIEDEAEETYFMGYLVC